MPFPPLTCDPFFPDRATFPHPGGRSIPLPKARAAAKVTSLSDAAAADVAAVAAASATGSTLATASAAATAFAAASVAAATVAATSIAPTTVLASAGGSSSGVDASAHGNRL